MPHVISVNVGRARPSQHTSIGVTGIDKNPVEGSIEVRPPGPKRGGLGSGLVGDAVCDQRHHGGDEQAVYAYAREDLDLWAERLGRPLGNGYFGENLTTADLDVNGARIGERWKIGDTVVLEATGPRIPCRTFAGWLQEAGWIKTFLSAARPGAYFRVVEPGLIRGGDPVTLLARPNHDVTIELVFRALTLEPHLLPRLLEADTLPEETAQLARRRRPMQLDTDP